MARPLFNDALQKPFMAAAKRGDLDTVRRYFALPEVLENVAIWDAEDRATRLGEPCPNDQSRRLPRTWYLGTFRGEYLFASSIVHGRQVEIFQWFFAREQLALFGETLRGIANDILHACLFAQFQPSREMAEIVVESPLFTEVMDDTERLQVLGKMLNTAASRGDAETLDLLLANGARLEGELLTQRHYDRVEGLVGDLLRRGADANLTTVKHGSALHEAASHCVGETVRLLVQEGFADVDTRDRCGRTPLMKVFGDGSHRAEYRVAKILLDIGANLHAVDDKHQGVLHYAMYGWSVRCLRVFLGRGADPNVRDTNGKTPVAALVSRARSNIHGKVREILDLLLETGADPFIEDNTGTSVVQMLETTKTGRAYSQEKQAFFRRPWLMAKIRR